MVAWRQGQDESTLENNRIKRGRWKDGDKNEIKGAIQQTGILSILRNLLASRHVGMLL